MVATVRRHVQRRQVIQSDVIDLRVVLQELPDTVHVITLRRHVDGRQSVLHRETAPYTVPMSEAQTSKMIQQILEHHHHLGFGLDGSSLVQEDLDDPDMAVPGSAMQWGQLVLSEAERKTNTEYKV